MGNLSSVAYEKKFPPAGRLGLTGEDQPIFSKQLRLDPTVWKIVYGYLWSSSQEICSNCSIGGWSYFYILILAKYCFKSFLTKFKNC
jgi:hypothetical protein